MERNTEMCKEWRGDAFMNTKRIITIGRQFGSGGREVGQKLAERLGIPYYDRELLARTAKESGLSEAVLKTMMSDREAFCLPRQQILMHLACSVREWMKA